MKTNNWALLAIGQEGVWVGTRYRGSATPGSAPMWHSGQTVELQHCMTHRGPKRCFPEALPHGGRNEYNMSPKRHVTTIQTSSDANLRQICLATSFFWDKDGFNLILWRHCPSHSTKEEEILGTSTPTTPLPHAGVETHVLVWQFEDLLRMLAPYLMRQRTNYQDPIEPEQRLAVCLR